MRIESLAEGGECGEVCLIRVEEMRDREGTGHGFEHLRLNWCQGESCLALRTVI